MSQIKAIEVDVQLNVTMVCAHVGDSSQQGSICSRRFHCFSTKVQPYCCKDCLRHNVDG